MKTCILTGSRRIAAAAIVLATLTAAALAKAPTEVELLETLRTAAAPEKALACKQLAIYGGAAAVPELARLLPDPQLSSWARVALEAIPGPEAGAALLEAAGAVEGKLRVGVINSIGVRRDEAAVGALVQYLDDSDQGVGAAAAVALGRIATDEATAALRSRLGSGGGDEVRSAVGEGCILCAERLLADGDAEAAAALYDGIRQADVPTQRRIEAIRGAILARGAEGVPLLLEQLAAGDEDHLNIGLSTARELRGEGVADELAAGLNELPAERAALLVLALGDRPDAQLHEAIVEAATKGDPRVRPAAIEMVGRLGGGEHVGPLLAIAGGNDADAAAAARSALSMLHGAGVEQSLVEQLRAAEGAERVALIEAIGQRGIEATDELVEALDEADEAIRLAALRALGQTVGFDRLDVLMEAAVEAERTAGADEAFASLQAACVRMPDRDACAVKLAEVLPIADSGAQVRLLEVLGAVGGPRALDAVSEAAAEGDDKIKDAASRVLGQWMTVDAGPALLAMAKDPAAAKYQVRALRGYLRLARQFTMTPAERASMCEQALAVSQRPAEQQLVLEILARYPSEETLAVAVKAAEIPAVGDEAVPAAIGIAQGLSKSPAEFRRLLDRMGIEPVELEITKAEYGARGAMKDVTSLVRQWAHGTPFIVMPSPRYNESFGGDPAPNVPKQLRIEYRWNGRAGTASFAENTPVVLAAP